MPDPSAEKNNTTLDQVDEKAVKNNMVAYVVKTQLLHLMQSEPKYEPIVHMNISN